MFKPLLAATVDDMSRIKYPVLVSPKIDGIRCLLFDGKVVSRALKAIPNNYIREQLGVIAQEYYFDGELVIPGASFQETSSLIMSRDGEPTFVYNVFDNPDAAISNIWFEHRHDAARSTVEQLGYNWMRAVPHIKVHNQDQLAEMESAYLSMGYEGLMIRSIDGPYKHGRSTLNEGTLLKLKRFADAEAEVIGVEPLYRNENEADKDNLGHTKRSTAQAGMVPVEMLGALIVRDGAGNVFNIGTGFNNTDRVGYWKIKDKLIGRIVNFKYQKVGTLYAPRFPVFRAFRHKEDLG